MNKMLLVAVAAFVVGAIAAALALGILANEQQTSAPAHATRQEQADCDTLAHKAADKWIADHHTSVTASIETIHADHVESHMNARLGECLVALTGEVSFDQSRMRREFGALFDAIDRHQFGYYYWSNGTEDTPDQPRPLPFTCYIDGVAFTRPCITQTDWYDAAIKFMRS